ncbi:MAG: SNF2-related protein [Syntrophomonadaceae bacterium]|nr:SNF2-related protein [Syntrophomonadaceae bacterium]
MFRISPELSPGQRVYHPELGEGVVSTLAGSLYASVFFLSVGLRQVAISSLQRQLSWEEEVVEGLAPALPQAREALWLALEAERLPLMDSSAQLTAARVDLLPHQLVLVHRLASTFPRRFLIADEVGLGKTIETALVLRELASRGQLKRALMVVPAGLVNNWAREMNKVFNLDFEVFGAQGDVSDRKSNAFARHDRLIASVDTLKRSNRIKRLLEAPPWDLVVFDEAHHLSAYKNGRRVRKTDNYKLAEALRDHCRDLLLLSATPHQGDHFRFWMLVRLLDPTLFRDEEEMLANRHRLNAVVIRRSKADACHADGSPLFARRSVHSQMFHLNEQEKAFYEALQEYLRDGYNLAEAQGGQARALGFVMTIFQKIAASSFAAVRETLRRRLLMLTVQEAITCDQNLDVIGRNSALEETRCLIHENYDLPSNPLGQAEVERVLADWRFKVMQRMQSRGELLIDYLPDEGETSRIGEEEAAAEMVTLGLPEERRRIKNLLAKFPQGTETKIIQVLRALGEVWQNNPGEKVVIFTTYLGSVNSIKVAIETAFPDKGAEVLKGGDHGAKLAAERRFKRPEGPKVMIATAAGREGINLQFARLLFNHDLPWNPMDIEQRIGRIHRYGQKYTAQVYNFVAVDTIEGSVFLMLEEKLAEIARTMGKVDNDGQVAEDFRSQVLGQLIDKISYEKLYQEALRDSDIRRTRLEIDVAMDNAARARNVVGELFQDLERFNVSDYQNRDDQGEGMRRLKEFLSRAVAYQDGCLEEIEIGNRYRVLMEGREPLILTGNRDLAMAEENIDLLGLEHPLMQKMINDCTALASRQRGLYGHIPDLDTTGIISIWRVEIHGVKGQVQRLIINIGVDQFGQRSRHLEEAANRLTSLHTANQPAMDNNYIKEAVNELIPAMLRRELQYSGLLPDEAAYSAHLLGLVVEKGSSEM